MKKNIVSSCRFARCYNLTTTIIISNLCYPQIPIVGVTIAPTYPSQQASTQQQQRSHDGLRTGTPLRGDLHTIRTGTSLREVPGIRQIDRPACIFKCQNNHQPPRNHLDTSLLYVPSYSTRTCARGSPTRRLHPTTELAPHYNGPTIMILSSARWCGTAVDYPLPPIPPHIPIHYILPVPKIPNLPPITCLKYFHH